MFAIISHTKKVTTCALVLGLLLLGGCETPSVSPDEGAYTTSKSDSQRAQEMVTQAASLASPERDRLLLQAAELYAGEERFRRAGAALNRLDETALNPGQRLLYLLLTGELALQRQDLEEAAQFIAASERAEGITAQPPAVRVRWHRTRGEILALMGEPDRSIYEFSRAGALLADDPPARQALHNTIWRLLGELSPDQINAGLLQSSDSLVAGWYQLASMIRGASEDTTLLVQNIQKWRRLNTQHPAAELPPDPLRRLTELEIITPRNIAILLPRGGEFELASQSLLDGILVGYYEQLSLAGEMPTLSFYDTNSGAIGPLYQRAVGEGADLVVGPLRREKVAELMLEPTLPVPVLGLNYVEDTPNPHANLYQFGLSIRDEASQIALQGKNLGYESALLILPGGRMGESARDAFTTSWTSQGGTIADTAIYTSADRDSTQLLAPALLIEQSRERATRLTRVLGKNFDYTPRRRGDVDMVLLIGYADSGRQIKPALDFLYAGDLPVFSTSHIYSGTPNPELDEDLEGIIFTALPWIRRGDFEPPPGLETAYKNLFAMGVDTYKLHQWLNLLKTLPDNEIRGQTGHLSLGTGNQVQRRLVWARFRNGVPVEAPDIALAGAAAH